MIIWLLILAAGIGVAVTQMPSEPATSSGPSETPTSPVPPSYGSLGSLPDCSPLEDQSSLMKDYDDYFYNASQTYGVPYALLKAHAQRESAMDHQAFRQEPNGKASYGLLQVLWWKNSNRFKSYGFNDDSIGDGSLLYDPQINANISAQIMRDNWNSTKNLRDMINMYNTGVKESKRVAPGNYVDNVLKYYSQIVAQSVG